MPFVLPRVYPILDIASLEAHGLDPVAAATALLDGGAEILQFRLKTHLTAALFDCACRIAELCRSANALWVVNDRADLALLSQRPDTKAALHIGQDDLPPAAARSLMGPEALIGLSTHNEIQLIAAAHEPVDYLAFGPVFGTVSKARPDATTGVDTLATLRPLTPRPLVAIGGITRARVPQVWAAGADSVAIIADLLPEECTLDGIRQRMQEWQILAR
jgi:thiamine-phosphate pyrophosphorylase